MKNRIPKVGLVKEFQAQFPHTFSHIYVGPVARGFMDAENVRLMRLAEELKIECDIRRMNKGFTFHFKTQTAKIYFWLKAYNPTLEPKCKDLTFELKNSNSDYIGAYMIAVMVDLSYKRIACETERRGADAVDFQFRTLDEFFIFLQDVEQGTFDRKAYEIMAPQRGVFYQPGNEKYFN